MKKAVNNEERKSSLIRQSADLQEMSKSSKIVEEKNHIISLWWLQHYFIETTMLVIRWHNKYENLLSSFPSESFQTRITNVVSLKRETSQKV